MNIELNEKELEFLIRACVLNYAEQRGDFEKDIGDYGICEKLIQKLCAVGKSTAYKTRDDALNSKWSEKEPLNKKLFLGAGWYSIIDINHLHKRLQYAVSILGGMQQNGGMGTEFDEQSNIEDKQTIKDVIKDMLMAFNLTVEDLK